LVLTGLAVAPSLPVAAALTVAWIGVVASAIAIPAATLLVDRSGGDLGGATAVMLIGFSGGSGVGALLSGAVADATSLAVPFALFAAVSLFTLALVRRAPHRL
jgi:predicted MFS family arabinose efflux permease